MRPSRSNVLDLVFLATYLRVSTVAYTANLLVVVSLSNVPTRLALYHRVDATGMLLHVGILVLVQRCHDGAQFVRRGDRGDGIKLALQCGCDASTPARQMRCEDAAFSSARKEAEPMMAVTSAGEAYCSALATVH
jgi:hypothetical protein